MCLYEPSCVSHDIGRAPVTVECSLPWDKSLAKPELREGFRIYLQGSDVFQHCWGLCASLCSLPPAPCAPCSLLAPLHVLLKSSWENFFWFQIQPRFPTGRYQPMNNHHTDTSLHLHSHYSKGRGGLYFRYCNHINAWFLQSGLVHATHYGTKNPHDTLNWTLMQVL